MTEKATEKETKRKAPSKKIEVKKTREIKTVQNKKGGKPIMVTSGIISPVAIVEDANTIEPFYYNKNSKPRYNVTLAFDRNDENDNDFIEWVDEVGTQAGVLPKIWVGRKKLYMIKFQTPTEIKIKKYVSESDAPKEITLIDEINRNDYVQIKFDIFKYYNRTQADYGFNFRPTEIYIYEDKTKDFFNVNYKNRGN